MVVIVFVIVSLQSIVSKRIHRTNGVVHNGGRCTAMRPDFVPLINFCCIFYFYCIVRSVIYHHKYSINTISINTVIQMSLSLFSITTLVAGAWTERKKMYHGGSFLKLADDNMDIQNPEAQNREFSGF